MKLLTEQPLSGQRLLIRQDLNVPLDGGNITSDARIRASLPTLKLALEAGAQVMVMSHLGRPSEGHPEEASSLAPVASHLAKVLGKPVRLVTDYLQQAPELDDGELVLLENVRFNVGEKADDEELSAAYASLCDIFAMDAFGTAHRAQASTHGVGLKAPIACAGPLLAKELYALGKALEEPTRPMVAIVGGSKVSTKLDVLETLSTKVDQLIVGGGIANTFIAAAGHEVGKSLHEPDLVEAAARLMKLARERGAEIPLPVDVVVADEFSEDAEPRTCSVSEIGPEDLVLDIGPQTAERYSDYLDEAGTVVWNGPVGVFEFNAFSHGTETLSRAIAESSAYSLAGGGDTLAAIDKYDVAGDISYISTGGGAFLEFLEGKTLPAVTMLRQRGNDSQAGPEEPRQED